MFVLAVGLLCMCLNSLSNILIVSNAYTTYDVKALIAKLKSVIEKSGAEVSVAFHDLENIEYFSLYPFEMHAASLMKVPVMIEVFRQAEQGKFSLDEKIKVTNEFKSIVDGSPYSLTVVEDSDDDIYKLSIVWELGMPLPPV
jgi:beta-lactamase class A